MVSRAGVLAEFKLPEYGAWLTAKKFFLFPLALTGDATAVGAAYGAAGLLESARQQQYNLKP